MPGGKGNIKPEDGLSTQWEKGQSGNPDGRPKKVYTVVKEMGYTKQDVETVFGELAWYSISDLREAAKDTDSPAIVTITAVAFVDAYNKKDFKRIKEIMEYVLGKPTQNTNLTGELRTVNVPIEKWIEQNSE